MSIIIRKIKQKSNDGIRFGDLEVGSCFIMHSEAEIVYFKTSAHSANELSDGRLYNFADSNVITPIKGRFDWWIV